MAQSHNFEAAQIAGSGRKKAVKAALLAGRFLASGLLAFLVDAVVLSVLYRGFGLDPFISRVAAISAAMTAGWLAHRTFTFSLATPPTGREFIAYASVAWTAAAANYAIYAGILITRPSTPPLVSLVIASLVTMVLSFLGMRFGVFGRPRSPAPSDSNNNRREALPTNSCEGSRDGAKR